MLEFEASSHGLSHSRKGDVKSRPLSNLAFHLDRAAMFVDDALGDGQAEAGAGEFGGKKGFEEVFQIFGSDARAGILDRDAKLRDWSGPAAVGRGVRGNDFRRDG